MKKQHPADFYPKRTLPIRTLVLSAGAVILLAAAGVAALLTRPPDRSGPAADAAASASGQAVSQSEGPNVLPKQTGIKPDAPSSPNEVPGHASVQQGTAAADPVSLTDAAGQVEIIGFSISEITPALEQRMKQGGSLKADTPVAIADLVYLTVLYLDFSGNVQTGELVVHRLLGEEVMAIFQDLLEAGFPIGSIRLIDDFNADDTTSMAANNSSAFCTRPILGRESGFSRHSYGIAIDLNPMQNPYVRDDQILPAGSEAYLDREVYRPGMIIPGQPAYEAFISRGWSWGGHWRSLKDYQHMEKIIDGLE